jgi:hypothetical protein
LRDDVADPIALGGTALDESFPRLDDLVLVPRLRKCLGR